jgi:hypothetical protein
VYAALDTARARFDELHDAYVSNYGYADYDAWRFAATDVEASHGPSAVPLFPPCPPQPVYRACPGCGQRGMIAPTDQGLFRRYRRGYASQCRNCQNQERRAKRNLARRGRRFGVEIEVVSVNAEPRRYNEWDECISGGGNDIDPHTIAEALAARGVPIDMDGAGEYCHTVIDAWKIVPDGSVDGWELVSPPLYWDQRDQVRAVCAVLSDLGLGADRSCGLHVHHEVCDIAWDTLRELPNTWRKAAPLTDRLVDPCRIAGEGRQWCAPWTERECRDFANLPSRGHMDYWERYKSLNVSCLNKYGTVEIRQHEGTTDAETILRWIAYGQALIEAHVQKVPVEPPTEIEDLREHAASFLDSLPFRCEASRDHLKSHPGLVSA